MTVASRLFATHRHKPELFIEALVAAMTLKEKLGQLSLYSAEQNVAANPLNPLSSQISTSERLDAVRRGLVGGFFNAVGVEQLRPLQQLAVTETRLGIPLIFAADVIHGFRTIFPVPLAEMASWDPELAMRTAAASASEASSAGIDWTFAPGMDVARDARWGRIVESSGEDVLLASRFAEARVGGYQQGDLARPDAIMATAKHFAGYGAAEAGLDYNTADISWRTLREHYLPPFRAAVEAGVGSVMVAFNDVDGVPCTANRALLTGVLREEWGFKGLIVSDYASDLELISHGLAESPCQAAMQVLLAGLDASLESGLIVNCGEELVATGAVPEAAVDAAVARMVRAKLNLGLFEDPFRRLDTRRPQVNTPNHRSLAREAACRSVVLLKNEAALPLRPGVKLALIGPLADDQRNLNGCWSLFGSSAESTTLRIAMQTRFGANQVHYAHGCHVDTPIAGGLDEACAAADAADVVILAIGESEGWSGEARSRAGIDLPPCQIDLARAVYACGKPVIAVVSTGRPVPLGEIEPFCSALLVGWFLGTESGPALCDILGGTVPPRGRLPVSFPRHAGQVPIYYNRKATGRPWRGKEEPFRSAYLDTGPNPLYPFGYGLTYTQFEIGETCASAMTFRSSEPLEIRANVTNRGERAGHVLLQLYVRDLAASVVRPIRELKDFRWVQLESGEMQTVRFALSENQLRFWTRPDAFESEPGEFEVWISDNAESGQSVFVTLQTGATEPAKTPDCRAMGVPI